MLLAAVLVSAACPRSSSTNAAADAGVAPLQVAPLRALVPASTRLQDDAALAAVAARTPQRPGHCAQVKSLPVRADADAFAERIRTQLSLPVEVVQADLGERGTWFRICVGAEESESRIVAAASQWTAPGGVLEPYLDPPNPPAPRFFPLVRQGTEARRATPEAASALAAVAWADHAPVLFAGADVSGLLLVGTAQAEGGGTEVVAVDPRGQRLLWDLAPAPGCNACTMALTAGPVRARRAVAADDITPAPGHEVVVEEDTASGTRLVSVFMVASGKLRRVASAVLESAPAGSRVRARFGLVDVDNEPLRELVLGATELRVTGEFACDVDTYVRFFDVNEGADGLVPITIDDVGDLVAKPIVSSPAMQPAPAAPASPPPRAPAGQGTAAPAVDPVLFVATLDSWGGHAQASHACAALLARSPGAGAGELCVRRVRRLLDDGLPIEAVNAAGMLAEASPPMRAAVSGVFLDAVTVVDGDPRLFAGEVDCAQAPLAEQVNARPLDDSIARARARQRERLALADIVDAVFVTGVRDFGADTPAGGIIGRWVERLRATLPGRAAALEALLLPPVVDAGTTSPTTAGFGGSP